MVCPALTVLTVLQEDLAWHASAGQTVWAPPTVFHVVSLAASDLLPGPRPFTICHLLSQSANAQTLFHAVVCHKWAMMLVVAEFYFMRLQWKAVQQAAQL